MEVKQLLQFDQYASYFFAVVLLGVAHYSSDIPFAIGCVFAALLWSAHASLAALTRRAVTELDARVLALERQQVRSGNSPQG